MKFSYTCFTALLLLPSLNNLLVNAELDGSSTCHSGPTIPGSFHGNDPAGTLAEGGYEVLVDDTVVSIDSTNAIESGTHKITIRQLSGTYIGMYAWANNAEALTVSSEDTTTKGGVSWTAGGNNVSCNGSSGLTHVDISDKTESSGILTMPSSSGSSVDVEFQMMTSFLSGSTFYYSRLTFEVEAPSTKTPTASPTKAPTDSPTNAPTVSPTKAPTASPTKTPTVSPTKAPTVTSSHTPTLSRSIAPTESLSQTNSPTQSPTNVPSGSFTSSPTRSPVFKQVTSLPSIIPTNPASVFLSDAPTEAPYQNDDMDDDDEESSFDWSSSSDSLDEDESGDDEDDDVDEDKDNENNYSNFSMSESSDQDLDSESIQDKDGGDGSFLRGSTKRKKRRKHHHL